MNFRTSTEIVAALSSEFGHLGVIPAGDTVYCGIPMSLVEIPNSDVALDVVDFLCETKFSGSADLIRQISEPLDSGVINTFWYHA